MSKFTVKLEVTAEFVPDGLSQEVQDLYMQHYQNLNEVKELDGMTSELVKHQAMIALAILQGEKEFVEGYGHLNKIIRDMRVDVIEIEES